MGSVTKLSSDYVLKEEINLSKNKKQFLVVNLLSVLLVIPPLPLLYFIEFESFDILLPIIGLGIFIVMIMIHEWIHGLFFKKYSNTKVTYKFHGWAASASTPGIYYYKNSYMVIGLAPAVIINSILLILFIVIEPFRLMLLILLAMHLSGCAGDFYVIFKMRKLMKNALIEDTGVGMNIFVSEAQ
ncbi:MAG: DUF3267 domain-containing protein [Acholeplasma sp.]|nr:DUF3267 domain-containing protein [Acholeplasma sp.]